MEIRELLAEDAERYQALCLEGLQDEPTAFLSSQAEEAEYTLEFVASRLNSADGSFTLGAFSDEILVGLVGLFRKRHAKEDHNSVVWGMYVEPSHRGQGLGRALLEAALSRARGIDGLSAVHLAVNEANPVARRLYESLGFETWGIEPDAFRVDEVPVTEIHMRLEL
jgi:RimJ/RimL family protein N-acetyltransferase